MVGSMLASSLSSTSGVLSGERDPKAVVKEKKKRNRYRENSTPNFAQF
jgi:hypothetical protein